MKRSILLRHASARDAPQDALRELSAAGQSQALRAGQKIAALGAEWSPTCALCSDAVRARATLAGARAALPALARVQTSERLYLASAAQLLATLREAPAREACVLVVAHEPGLSSLVRLLADRGDPAARARFARGMGPASFAALALDIACWADAAPGSAELAAFELP